MASSKQNNATGRSARARIPSVARVSQAGSDHDIDTKRSWSETFPCLHPKYRSEMRTRRELAKVCCRFLTGDEHRWEALKGELTVAGSAVYSSVCANARIRANAKRPMDCLSRRRRQQLWTGDQELQQIDQLILLQRLFEAV